MALGSLGFGCATGGGTRGASTEGAGTGGAPTARDVGPMVLPTDGVLAYERSVGGPDARYARFEHGRNNEGVSARMEVPILATNRWPVPPKPAERWIRFNRWRQR